MLKFYQEIAKHYHIIFPVQKAQIDFLRNQKNNVKTLDIACGDGNYLKSLTTYGFYGMGIDVSEDMIQLAKSNQSNKQVKFQVMNMLNLDLLNDKYEFIYIIGNSLPHLASFAEVENFFHQVYKTLIDNGRFSIQIINFDRIRTHNIQQLPTIKNQNLELKRMYELKEDVIVFKTVLKTEKNCFENSVTLLSIESEQLLKTLNNVGFKNIQCYGDFMRTSFQKDQSYYLVVDAFK